MNQSRTTNLCIVEEENATFMDSEKNNNQYVIGVCDTYNALFGAGINTTTFYNYSHKMLSRYLSSYCLFPIEKHSKLHVIQLKIENDMYVAVQKTHWLRIIQRCWKKTFHQRKLIMTQRTHLKNIHYFERHGKHLNGLNIVPSIRGMLCNIQSNVNK